MQDADVELRRRRDRGKVAQRAFRQRQSEGVRKLKADHERLRRLVGDIVEASRSDDAAQLNLAIVEAGRAAGLDMEGYPRETTADPRVSSSSSDDVESERRDAVTTLERETMQRSMVAEVPPPPDSLQPRQDFFPVPSLPYDGRPGRMSPRMDYGVWLDPDRFLRVLEPPLDIRPYVGVGRYTIAGRIAWACLDYGFAVMKEAVAAAAATDGQSCNNDKYPGYPGVLSTPAACRAFDLALRHSPPLHDVEYMAALLEARMEFRRLGHSSHRGADEVERQRLQKRVWDDLQSKGVDFDRWYSPLEVERHLARKMGARYSAFQAGLHQEEDKTASTGRSLSPLCATLAPRAVCFGDGPRWRADDITVLADAWVGHLPDAHLG